MNYIKLSPILLVVRNHAEIVKSPDYMSKIVDTYLCMRTISTVTDFNTAIV